MYITQEIADKIKLQAKLKKITMKELLFHCELNINAISEFAKGKQLSCLSLARIADYLDCSVDYLLGRENKKGIDIVASKVKDFTMENYNEKTSVLVSDVEGWNIKNTPTKNNDTELATSENEAELLAIYRSLNLRDKTTLMNFVFEMQDKANKA